VRVIDAPTAPQPLPSIRVERRRQRSYPEWAALRRWGKLPAAEAEVVGYRLRDLREAAALTQRELAVRLGVSQQAVAQAERWSANPTFGFVRRWADACGGRAALLLEPHRDGE